MTEVEDSRIGVIIYFLAIAHGYILTIGFILVEFFLNIRILPALDIIETYTRYSLLFILIYCMVFIIFPMFIGYVLSFGFYDYFFHGLAFFGDLILAFYLFFKIFGIDALNFAIGFSIIFLLAGKFHNFVKDALFIRPYELIKKTASLTDAPEEATIPFYVLLMIIKSLVVGFSIFFVFMNIQGFSFNDSLLIIQNPYAQIALMLIIPPAIIIGFLIFSLIYSVVSAGDSTNLKRISIIDFTLNLGLLSLVLSFGNLVAFTVLSWIFFWNITIFLIPIRGIPIYLKPFINFVGFTCFIITISTAYIIPSIFFYMQTVHIGSFTLFDVIGGIFGALSLIRGER